jgi:predicted PurR-regulated permease PerM
MDDRKGYCLFKLSLRELLLVVGAFATGCAALKFANNPWWYVLSALALSGILSAAVIAAVDRGRPQAFALGFVICAATYGLFLVLADKGGQLSRELDPYEGRLPTTRLLRPLFELIVDRTWYESQTGKPLPGYQPAGAEASPIYGSTAVSAAGPIPYAEERPTRNEFMRLGHLLWGLLLGYLGGRLGAVIYTRRVRRAA